jgi:hypothetical protein
MKTLHSNTKTVVGDSHYGASVIGNKLRKERGLVVISVRGYFVHCLRILLGYQVKEGVIS